MAKKPEMSEAKLLDIVTEINAEHFGNDDAYSDVGNVLKLIHFDQGGYLVEYLDGQVAGYLLYDVKGDKLSCVRRGVTRSAKRKGLGLKLTKRAIKLSIELDKVYKTYCSVNNMPSLNSNIKCGLVVTRIDEDWVYLETKKP